MNSTASSIKSTCVLVLGVHRSGTSALTRCLSLVGMDLGSHLLSPAEMNAKGFWEHGDVVRINDQLLEAFGLYWYDLTPLPDGWLMSEAADAARKEIRAIIKRDFDSVPLWGLKDPRLCRLAPLWIEVLREMGIRAVSVFMIRSPVEVAKSLSRFPDYRLEAPLSIPHGILLWAQDLAESVLAADSIPKVMVDYEHLLSDPVAILSKVGHELGLDWPISPTGRADAVAAFLDVGMRTHRNHLSEGSVPLLVMKLFRAATAVVGDPSPAKWSLLVEISVHVLEQVQAVSYLGPASGFKDRGYAALKTISADWVPNAALYYATNDDPAFSEARCILKAVPLGRHHLDLVLPATAGKPVRLRFDPLDRRGAYILHSLVLFDRFGEVVWTLSDARCEIELVGARLLPSLAGPGHSVAYTDLDPWICIELPQDVSERRVTKVRVDMECLDAGALSREVFALAERASVDKARIAEQEETLQRQDLAFTEERGRLQLRADELAERLRISIESNQREVESSRHEADLYRREAESNRREVQSSRQEIERLIMIQSTQARELQAIHASSMWRVMLRLRSVMSRIPAKWRHQLRRVLKAAWWCATPWLLPARWRFLRERKAVRRYQEALHATSAPAADSRPAVISFIPAKRGGLATAKGNYQLSKGRQHYTYVPPRPPLTLEHELAAMPHAPRFSIVVPVYNTPLGLLDKLVCSVLAQWYPHWELILVNDNSSLDHVRVDLERQRDPRITVVHLTENKRIALATNEGIARATGDYIVFADHDDELTPDCLYELARCVGRESPDFIYSDEDKIDELGQYVQPFFKPDWSPDTMISTMYTCHVSCVRRELVNELGGLRPGYDGCQDWDFILRVVEKTKRIAHIPKVLYHWRIIPASVASGLDAKPHVIATSKRVREDAMARRGLNGVMEPVGELPGYFRAVYRLQGEPRVSMIILTKNNHRNLKRCIDSIELRSTYRNFEIVVVDCGSADPVGARYIESLRRNAGMKVLSYDKPFNYAAATRFGVQAACGELVLFLNDSVEVLAPDWLERMGGYAQLPHVGAVGAKLLSSDRKFVQHVGIVNLSTGPGHGFSGMPVEDHGYFARAVLEYNWLAVAGACLMVERSKFERVGGFDEDFPAEYSDTDFCFRLIEAGYYNLASPAVTLINHEAHGNEADGGDHQAELSRRMHLLYQKHPRFYMYDPFHSPNLAPDDSRFGLSQ